MEMRLVNLNVIKINSLKYEEFYERFLKLLGYNDPLDPEFIKKNKLEFGRLSFLKNLNKMIPDSSNKFEDNDDLTRLFFKWIVYINEQFWEKKCFGILSEIINPIYDQLKTHFSYYYTRNSLNDYFYEPKSPLKFRKFFQFCTINFLGIL